MFAIVGIYTDSGEVSKKHILLHFVNTFFIYIEVSCKFSRSFKTPTLGQILPRKYLQIV